MCKRGDIFYIDFGAAGNTHKQKGVRPAVIVSNNKNNGTSPTITVVPLTSKIKKKRHQPTHVQIPKRYGGGLSRNSMALAEQLETVDRTSLREKIGEITNDVVMEAITVAVMIQIGAYDEYNEI